MNKIYVVTNGDESIMGVFTTKEKAESIVKIGKKLWNETWGFEAYKIDNVSPWLMKMEELEKLGISIGKHE